MARIPVITPRNAINPGSAPRIQIDTSIARGAQNVGNALINAGERFSAEDERKRLEAEAEAKKAQAATNNTWFSKARADASVFWQQRENELRQEAGVDNPDYLPKLNAEYQEYVKRVEASAPTPEAAQSWQQWSPTFGGQLGTRAVEAANSGVLAKREADFNSALAAHAQVIAADPDQFDTVYARAMDDIDGATAWMTPEQEAKVRATVDKQLKLVRAGTIAKMDPVRFLEETGLSADVGATTVNKIIGIESGGNPNAKNPRSSAEGLGQFTDGTWLATLDTHRPDLAGLPRAEKLKLKFDPQIAREMTAAHTKDNETFLRSNGLPVTEGSLYLAHFAGAGGAKKLLRADPGASAVSVLGEQAIKANPFLRGKTAGEVIAWADKKMGSAKATPTFAGNANYEGLSVDDIWSLEEQANQVINARQRDLNAQMTADLAAMKGAFQLQIATGEPISRADILSSALPDDDKAQLITTLNARDKDTSDVTSFLRSVEEGTFAGNPLDTETQKVVDKGYEAAAAAQPNASQAIAETMATRTGVVPKGYLNDVRVGLMSGNPAQVLEALQQAQRLRATSPTALTRDNAKGVADAAIDFDYMTNRLGYTPEEAARKHIAINDPERRTTVNDAEIEKATKAIDIGKVTDLFDPGILSAEPSAGFTKEQQAAFLGDFREVFRREYIETQDATIAMGRAEEKFKRLYAATRVTGDPVLMKFPPESYYPPDANGSHQYLQDQALAAVREATGKPELTADKMFLVATPDTAADVRAGRAPSYLMGVVTEDANGYPVYDVVSPNGMQFRFDTAAGLADAAAKAAAAREERARIAREQEDIKRGMATTGDPVMDDLNRMRNEQAQPGMITGGQF